MKFSLSCCWNSHRHEDGYAMLEEIAALGFAYAELSHGVRISLVPGILKALDDGVIRVSSVHNFCPLPVGVTGAAPNLFEPTAPTDRERMMWLRQTLRTIEFAERIECDRMVLHSGSVRFWWRNPESAFEKHEDAKDEVALVARDVAREKLLARMRKSQPKYKTNLLTSLKQIAEACEQAGVKVGLENREGATELPLDSEMLEVQQEMVESKVFGYWHDAGHAQLKERSGFIEHAEFLSSLRPHLVGFHLHDVSDEGRDHQIPGSGTIDWDMIAAQIREEDTVVMELSPRLRSEEISAGREFLLEKIPLLRGA